MKTKTKTAGRRGLGAALGDRVLVAVDALLYLLFFVPIALVRAAAETRARPAHGALLIAAGVAALYGMRLWRECAPAVAALVENDGAVALDVRCDPRTPQHAAFARHLDCVGPRATLAKGARLLTLECALAKLPLVSYAGLVAPLFYPERARTLEWLQGAAVAILGVLVASWVVPTLLAWRREERMHTELRTVVHALNRASDASARREREHTRERRGRGRTSARDLALGAPRLLGAARIEEIVDDQ